MFKTQKGINDIVPDLKVRGLTTLLTRYGFHNLSYLSCYPVLVTYRKQILTLGWNGFKIKLWIHLFLLESKFSYVLYCGSVEA